MYRVRLWSIRHAHWLNVLYEGLEKVLVSLHPLFVRIGYQRAERWISVIEAPIKRFLFDSQSAFRPYVGIGINYTTFFSEDLTSFAKNELAARSLELDDSWGVSWRAGIDWDLNNNWMLNASAWKIDLETDASFDSALGAVKVSVDVDPWVYMLSLGYKF